MCRLLVVVFALGLLPGCFDGPASAETTADKIDQYVSEIDARAAQLDQALTLARAILAGGRVAGAEACKRFASACEPIAMIQAEAELAMSEAERALQEYRERRGDLDRVRAAIGKARAAAEGLIGEITHILKSSA